MKWYVHYTVKLDAKHPPEKLVTGPYSVAEVLDKRRDIAQGANVTDCYISEESK